MARNVEDARHANDISALMALENELHDALKSELQQVGSALDAQDYKAATLHIRTCMFLEKFIADIAALEE
jgi:molecular chaperone HscB